MSSDSGISASRGSLTDSYAHCHSIPNPSYADFNTTENKIVEILTKNKTASTIDSQNLSNYEVVKVADSMSSQIMPVCYPSDAIESDAVLVSVFKNNQVVFDSIDSSLNNVSCVLSVDNTSTSIYDSVVRVETTIDPIVRSLDNSVDVVFDLTNSNAPIQYAVNSQFNTKTDIIDMNNANVYPTYVQEHTQYNSSKAFGKNYTQYISSISENGEPVWENYSNTQPAITDKFLLTSISHKDQNNNSVDFNNAENIGIFKVSIVLDEQPFKTVLEVGDNLADELETVILNDTQVKKMPLFQETNGFNSTNQEKIINTDPDSDNSRLLLPSSDMTQNEFLSLIHPSNQSVIQPNFSFKVDITSNENSGYSFNDSSYNFVNMDDTELKDSLIYMKDWVNYPHNITLSEGQLSLDVATGGMNSMISGVIFAGERERLPLGKAGVNGVLTINSHTLLTRSHTVAETENNNTQVVVYYDGDTIPLGLSKVDNELCSISDISFGWQKVAEATSESNTYFKKNTNTTLNLVSNNNIINDSFLDDVNNFTYVFNSNNLPSTSANNNVELWEINCGLNIISQPDRIISDTGVQLNGVETSVLLKNATRAFNDTNREIRQKISLKRIADLSITSDIQSNGWIPSLTDGTTILESSSVQAYREFESLPVYNYDLFTTFMSNNNNDGIPYKLEYKTTPEGSLLSSLLDMFEVSYNNDESNTFIISEGDMMTTDLVIDQAVNVDVPLNMYEFSTTTSVKYSKSTHKLIKTIFSSRYKKTFTLPLGQYRNYQVTTPLIQCTSEFYTIIIKSTGAPVTQRSTALTRVINTGPGGSGYYTKTYQTVSPVNNTESLVIEGVLYKKDLKEVFLTTQAKNMLTDVWENISVPTEASVFYSVENEPIINDIKLDSNDAIMPGTNNVETTLYFTGYELSTNSEVTVDLTSAYYVIPLVIDYTSTVFSLRTFRTSSNKDDLVSKTNLTSSVNTSVEDLGNKVLSIDDLYSVIKPSGWEVSPSDYKIVTSIVDNDVTIKVVKTDDPNNAIITIGVNDNYIFVGGFLVSNIKKDVIRKRSLLDETYSEVFLEVEPEMSSFAITNGVYVNKTNNLLLPLGSYQLFELKKDLLKYNLVGNNLGSYTEISSLGPYKWVSEAENYYSDSFTLSKYRGYGHNLNTLTSSSIDQYYNIVRPPINATFMITKTVNNVTSTLSQTYSNIYAGQNVVVNSLKRDITDVNPSDIGLKLTFNNSLPNKIESRNKLVNVNGDDVTVKIANPLVGENVEYTPIANADSLAVQNISKTLKTYNIFSFDGASSYRYYDGPMRVRSSRVKLLSNNVNNLFTKNVMRYSITWNYDAAEAIVKVSKARITSPLNNLLNFVGNPESVGSITGSSWGNSNQFIALLNLEDAQNKGVNIGVHNIKLLPNIDIIPTNFYYVSSPAYYKYETMSSANNITIPYNYTSQFNSNRVVRYVPNIVSQIIDGYVSPFNSITYSDMFRTMYSVTTDNTVVNNMKFKLANRIYSDLHYAPISAKKEIKLFGSKMKIDILKNNLVVKNIYNDYITSLSENLSNNITLVPSTISSGIKFMIRQPLTEIGYTDSDDSFISYYNTNDKSKWFPFKFSLSNVNMFKSTSMNFNMLAGPGTYPLLYTVKDVLSYSSPELLYRRLYKYESDSAMDFDSASDLEPMKTSLLFRTRKYLDIPVTLLSRTASFNTNRFSEMLESITITGPLQWVDDVDFNELDTSVAVSLLYGTSEVSRNFRRECFYTNHNETVFTLIHYSPFMTMVNQVGMPLYSVQWNGLLKVPEVLSEGFVLSGTRTRNVMTNANMTAELLKHTNLRL